MRMRIATIVLAAFLVAAGALLSFGITPIRVMAMMESSPSNVRATGLVLAAFGLILFGRRRPKVRFVTD